MSVKARHVKSPNCTFCAIAHQENDTELLYKDEEFVAFRDIRPATPHHYLIIPKNHVNSAKVLTYNQKELVEKLLEIGMDVLEKQGGKKENLRLGFHWPPFVSISHLHLHVIADADQMSFLSKLIFKPNSLWFATYDYVLDRLEKMKPPNEDSTINTTSDANVS